MITGPGMGDTFYWKASQFSCNNCSLNSGNRLVHKPGCRLVKNYVKTVPRRRKEEGIFFFLFFFHSFCYQKPDVKMLPAHFLRQHGSERFLKIIALVYIYQLTKFGYLMSCGSKECTLSHLLIFFMTLQIW